MNRIKEIREEVGMTQTTLAQKTCLSRATIVNYESGRRVPRMDDIEKIAIALGRDVCDFFYNPPQHLTGKAQASRTGGLQVSTENAIRIKVHEILSGIYKGMEDASAEMKGEAFKLATPMYGMTAAEREAAFPSIDFSIENDGNMRVSFDVPLGEDPDDFFEKAKRAYIEKIEELKRKLSK